jgi:hypothetical protein
VKLPAYACLDGTEIMNEVRTQTYLNAGLVKTVRGFGRVCPALNDGFVSPTDDPAPWYDSDHPESAGFMGILADGVELSPVLSASSTPRLDEGAVIGAEVHGARGVLVQGWMVATDQRAMYWGERWLNEALRGTNCGCGGSDLELLSSCSLGGAPYDDDFRLLPGAKLISPPIPSPIEILSDCKTQNVQFQMQAPSPWLFSLPTVAVDDVTVVDGSGDGVVFATEDWRSEALVITVSTDAGFDDGAMITITESLDGATCPEDRVAASAIYELLDLAPESSLEIDAMRTAVTYANPTSHLNVPGFDKLSRETRVPFCWPTIPRCNTVCVYLTNETGDDVVWRVERRKREL